MHLSSFARPAIYIGDTVGDILEAKRAGAKTAAVTWVGLAHKGTAFGCEPRLPDRLSGRTPRDHLMKNDIFRPCASSSSIS
jgi:hypothetical protein